MKKLVKTAKQQFEERRKELTYRYQYELSETEIYYAYEGVNAYFCILREHNGEYKEIAFGEQYEAFVFSEIFLGTMAEYFRDHNLHIKPLFDWYASADHDCEPFTLMDIWMLDLNKAECVYEDIYEEVPDVRIITAKEQWENDSKDFTIQENEGDYPFKVVIDDESLRFYYYEYGYYCDIYPPLESLRKDDIFIKDVTDRLLEFANYEGVGRLQDWIRVGGDFPLSFGWIFYSEYPRTDVIEYEDKELSQEQTIEEMIALTPEQQEKVKEFEVALKSLKDSGVKIISYWDENEFFAVNGNSNVELDCSYYLSKKDYENSEDISVLLQKKHRFPFSWDLYWGVDTCFCAKKL